ncbi:MAG: 2-oxoglutarate ferredoxin oxidoreductase subunit alpha [Planctomycetes bacterium]|nr:2-oxoglutarate ferredoxin oxidoreductase subunit alpha [Planctomycetota bacterium]
MTKTKEPGAELPLQQQEEVTIRFAGDSGDGMQVTGNQFTNTSAVVGNDLATLPDFPAEIRAPAGTRPGVSGFQIHFSSADVHTPGDAPDVLVAMNPAALVVNIGELKPGGMLVVNTGSFGPNDLRKARLEKNPLEDGSVDGYRVIEININERVRLALADSPLSTKEVQRCKNFYTLGLMYWLYSRPLKPTMNWLQEKFAKRPELVEANQKALQAGFNAGDIHEMFQGRYDVQACDNLPAGTYRNIMGNQALGLGLLAGAEQSGLKLFLGAYPITPASDLLHQLALYKNFGVITFQAEDEIAAICAALGASFAGCLGLTTTSGPGVALKAEAMGLAVSVELPLVIVDVQRAGPSTGMPTKVEQTDLLQSIFGRNGEAPIPVLAASAPTDAFDCALEACRIAVEYMTPVILLSDNYIANGSEPWKLPDLQKLPEFKAKFRTNPEGYLPFMRDDRGMRPWVVPGTPGMQHRIGGLEKEDGTGNVSYDAENHSLMTHRRHDRVQSVRETIDTPEIFGPDKGEVLMLGWGGTRGSIQSAADRCRAAGMSVANMHMRHLWPLPKGLDEIFSSYKCVLVCELNLGQFFRVLRSEFPQYNFLSYTKVEGKPFQSVELTRHVQELLEQ